MDLGEVIATRELQLRDPSGSVLIEVGLPRSGSDKRDWICPFRISGLGRGDILRYAAGIDGMQAMMLAFDIIGSYIHTSQAFRHGRLFWLEQGNTDLGLPNRDIDGPPTGNPANDRVE